MSEQKADDTAAASGMLASDNATLLSNSSNNADSGHSNSKAEHTNGEAGSTAAAGDASPSASGGEGEAAVAAGVSGSGDGADGNAEGSASGEHGEQLDGSDAVEEEEEEEEQDATELDTVAANDVKNIILQVLSPYFDDDAGGAADVAGVEALGVGAAGSSPSGSPNTANKDGGNTPNPTAAPQDEDAGEDVAQRYDHTKAEMWIARICDGIMERLVGLGKPFKFVVHTMVMRKCGAGLHVCSSCYYAPSDGWLSHAHDLSAHLYAVVTVYWCAM